MLSPSWCAATTGIYGGITKSGQKPNKNSYFYSELAVQQAEATYDIKASHPLFFYWEVEPSKKVQQWLIDGHADLAAWILSYLVFQIFIVAIAAVVFSKIGHQ
eukprot:s7836_g5.t1